MARGENTAIVKMILQFLAPKFKDYWKRRQERKKKASEKKEFPMVVDDRNSEEE